MNILQRVFLKVIFMYPNPTTYGKPFSHLIRICIYLQLIADISN